MTERRKRRKWSIEEKFRIVAQTRVPGVSVPQIAQRYDVNANLIFKWVRDLRYGSAVDLEPEPHNFLPVEVTPNLPTVEPVKECPEQPGVIKISMANGHHMEITGNRPDIYILIFGLWVKQQQAIPMPPQECQSRLTKFDASLSKSLKFGPKAHRELWYPNIRI